YDLHSTHCSVYRLRWLESMSYEFWIGARYAGLARSRRRGRSGDRFVSFIAASSMAGIALGVAALIIVLSVMNGFQVQVRDRMLSVLPHIELYAPGVPHQDVLDNWKEIAGRASADAAVKGAAPFVAAQGMIARGQALQGVQLRGIDPTEEDAVSGLSAQFVAGSSDQLSPGRFGIALGLHLARALRVAEGGTGRVLAAPGAAGRAVAWHGSHRVRRRLGAFSPVRGGQQRPAEPGQFRHRAGASTGARAAGDGRRHRHGAGAARLDLSGWLHPAHAPVHG